MERFDRHYPHLRGSFARVIDFQVNYAQSLINDFSHVENNPHIAISVDMLDTGIDVPEIVNLAFFKIVRSKTKFWQMVGRGTRLRPDMFGPGQHKKFFRIIAATSPRNNSAVSLRTPSASCISTTSSAKRWWLRCRTCPLAWM